MDAAEARRARARTAYAAQYPVGFKRKRDPEQREKQRVAQQRYERQQRSGPHRRYWIALQKFAAGEPAGPGYDCKVLTGLDDRAFRAYVMSSLKRVYLPFALRFRVPLHKFDFGDDAERAAALHYRNCYAVPKRTHAALVYLS